MASAASWLPAQPHGCYSPRCIVYLETVKLITDVLCQFHGVRDCEELQADLDSIQHWSEKWQMKFNSSKCKIMHLGHSSDRAEYTMHNTTTTTSPEPFYGPFSGTTWVSRCQKRTSGLSDARED